jgi:hypothetical protein
LIEIGKFLPIRIIIVNKKENEKNKNRKTMETEIT